MKIHKKVIKLDFYGIFSIQSNFCNNLNINIINIVY